MEKMKICGRCGLMYLVGFRCPRCGHCDSCEIRQIIVLAAFFFTLLAS